MDDDQFLSKFESAAIASVDWAHRDHVRMAFLYLRALPFENALARVRSGIRTLNRANGIIDTPTSGYHETLTVAWARIVAGAIRSEDAQRDFESFASANPQLLNKELLRLHYTKERILSAEARTTFVEPDIAALPRAATA